MFSSLRCLNGPQTMGNGPAFWTGFAVMVAAAFAYPLGFDPYDVGNAAYFLIWVFAARSACRAWTGLALAALPLLLAASLVWQGNGAA